MKKFLLLFLFSSANATVIFPEGDIILDLEESEAELDNDKAERVFLRRSPKEAKEELQSLQKYNNINSTRIIELKNRYKYFKDYAELPSFLAVLKKGSSLQSIDTDKAYRTHKPIYVKTRLTHPGSNYNYVLNKEGNVIYLTKAVNVTSIEEDIALRPKYDTRVNHKVENSFRANDRYMAFSNHLQLELESKDISYFQQNIEGIDTNQASSTNAKYKIHFVSSLPITFGLTASLHGNSLATNTNKASWTQAFYGASVAYPFWKSGKWASSASLEVGKSLFDNLTVEDSSGVSTQYLFSTNYYQLNGEVSYDSKYGTFFVGAHYSKYQSSLSNYESITVNFNPDKFSNSGMGMNLGYKFEFEL